VRVVGIEPTLDGLRIRCLTSWLGAHGALWGKRARCLSSFDYSVFKADQTRRPRPFVGRPGIEPSGLTTRPDRALRAVGGNRTRHSGLASRRVSANTSTARRTNILRPVRIRIRTSARICAFVSASYEDVSVDSPTDRTSPSAAIQTIAGGARTLVLFSIRRVCPASSFHFAAIGCALRWVDSVVVVVDHRLGPETAKGREPFGSPALESILKLQESTRGR
jgi:hypothetical protein